MIQNEESQNLLQGAREEVKVAQKRKAESKLMHIMGLNLVERVNKMQAGREFQETFNDSYLDAFVEPPMPLT